VDQVDQRGEHRAEPGGRQLGAYAAQALPGKAVDFGVLAAVGLDQGRVTQTFLGHDGD
jgi:hypothetical protein